MKARVTVYPRPGLLDPQGKAIHQALQRLGFPAVSAVRAGKSFELDLAVADADEARRQLREMCDQLLANTVVEDYRFELLDEGAQP